MHHFLKASVCTASRTSLQQSPGVEDCRKIATNFPPVCTRLKSGKQREKGNSRLTRPVSSGAFRWLPPRAPCPVDSCLSVMGWFFAIVPSLPVGLYFVVWALGVRSSPVVQKIRLLFYFHFKSVLLLLLRMENSASAALSINLNTPTRTHTARHTHTNAN